MIVVKYRNKYNYQKNWYSWNQIVPYVKAVKGLTDLITQIKEFDAFKNIEHDKGRLYKSHVMTIDYLMEFQILFYDTEINKFIREENPWKVGINDKNLL